MRDLNEGLQRFGALVDSGFVERVSRLLRRVKRGPRVARDVQKIIHEEDSWTGFQVELRAVDAALYYLYKKIHSSRVPDDRQAENSRTIQKNLHPHSDFFSFSVGPTKKSLHPHPDFIPFSAGPIEKTLHPHPDFF